MKKHHSKNKIIPFPQLDARLIEMGKVALQEGDFQRAIDLLDKARQLSPEDADVLFSLAVAYLQQGNNQMARQTAEEMLYLGVGDYFSNVELYISILFQMHDYDTIYQYVKALKEEHLIPFEKMEQYEDILRLCEKMVEEDHDGDTPSELPEDIFHGSFNEVLENLTLLRPRDISKYIESMKEYLEDESKNPFIKTALLNVLWENKWDEVLIVKKFGKTVKINLQNYYPPQQVPFVIQVTEQIENKLSQDNPTWLEFARTIIHRFFFTIYPLEKEFNDPNIWADAIMKVVEIYVNDSEYDVEELDEPLVGEALRFILTVEENSSIPL